MKTLLSVLTGACLVSFAQAQQLVAGSGVANDHATGTHVQDVTFVTRGAGNPYGYRGYDLPFGVTLLPWSFPNNESSVYGLRFNFGWGSYVNGYGLDSGVISVLTGDFGGFSATVLGNCVDGSVTGVQVGLVNYGGGEVRGLQVGVVNVAGSLKGVQLGVLNFNNTGITLPLINAGW